MAKEPVSAGWKPISIKVSRVPTAYERLITRESATSVSPSRPPKESLPGTFVAITLPAKEEESTRRNPLETKPTRPPAFHAVAVSMDDFCTASCMLPEYDDDLTAIFAFSEKPTRPPRYKGERAS